MYYFLVALQNKNFLVLSDNSPWQSTTGTSSWFSWSSLRLPTAAVALSVALLSAMLGRSTADYVQYMCRHMDGETL